jgi:hypothetical protein
MDINSNANDDDDYFHKTGMTGTPLNPNQGKDLLKQGESFEDY